MSSYTIAPPSTALIAALLPSALPPPPPRRARIAHPPPPQAHPGCLECGLPWGIPCIVLVAPPTDNTPVDCSQMDVGTLDIWPFDNRPGRMEDEDEASPPHRYTLPPTPGTVLPVTGRAPVPPQRPSRPSSAPSLDIDLSELDDFVSWTESTLAALLGPVRHAPVSRFETRVRREAGRKSRVVTQARRARQAPRFVPLPVVEEVEEVDGHEEPAVVVSVVLVDRSPTIPLRRTPRTARRPQRCPLADRTNTASAPPPVRRGIRTAIKTAKARKAELAAKGKV